MGFITQKIFRNLNLYPNDIDGDGEDDDGDED